MKPPWHDCRKEKPNEPPMLFDPRQAPQQRRWELYHAAIEVSGVRRLQEGYGLRRWYITFMYTISINHPGCDQKQRENADVRFNGFGGVTFRGLSSGLPGASASMQWLPGSRGSSGVGAGR